MDSLQVHRGNFIPTAAAAAPPAVRFDASRGNGPWVLAMVSPDGRRVGTEAGTVNLHWLLPGLVSGDAVDSTGPPAVPYSPPAPAEGGEAYRYVLCLLEQTTGAELDCSAVDDGSVHFASFLKQNKLRPVGLAFFQAEHA